MGLDIRAYSNIEPDPSGDPDDAEISVYHGDFPERCSDLKPGPYRKTPRTAEHGFRAGSYSGYNWWRNQLSLFAFNVVAETVWSDWDTYKDKPFAELVYMSDCEGSIGPAASARLAKAFADHLEAAEKYSAAIKDGGYWLLRYRDWQQAFDLASLNGVVKFC